LLSGRPEYLYVLQRAAQEHRRPDLPNDHEKTGSTHVSLRVPADLIAAFDHIAAALERPRSWVMVRALRQYVEDGEGAEIEEDTESIAELDRGEVVPFEESMRKIEAIIAKAEAKRSRDK
jgi:predicted transcriptional regulator